MFYVKTKNTVECCDHEIANELRILLKTFSHCNDPLTSNSSFCYKWIDKHILFVKSTMKYKQVCPAKAYSIDGKIHNSQSLQNKKLSIWFVRKNKWITSKHQKQLLMNSTN